MKRLIRLFVSLLVPALMLAFPAATPAMKHEAEKGKATIKVLSEDDKVRVQQVTFKPGDEGANVARLHRVIYPLKGGTIQRTHPDGKTDKIEYKTGEVKVFEASKPFVPKNVGTSDIVFLVVLSKEPKKM